MSKQINKTVLNELRQLAIRMPQMYLDIPVYRVVSGEILISKGIVRLPNGETVKRDKSYQFKEREQRPINMVKQLKKVYLKGGINAVKKYVEDCIEVNTPKQIGGIKSDGTIASNW